MLVSVIIPYYNKVSTIDRAVSSVINQTYTNWELIIIDDKSTFPLEFKNQWKNYPIKNFINEINLGPGPTRQKGMELSKGELLAFLDADDWWHENFLQSGVEVHQKNNQIAATWCKSKVLVEKNKWQERGYNQQSFNDIRETLITYQRPWQTGSLIWKKKYCGTWGNLSTNQDSWFEISSSKKSNEVIQIPEFYYFVDQTAGNHRSTYVTNVKTYFNNFELFSYLKKMSEEQGIETKYKIILFNRLLKTILRIKQHASKEEFIIYWKKFKELYSTIYWLFQSTFMMKLTHRFLQKSPFKINY